VEGFSSYGSSSRRGKDNARLLQEVRPPTRRTPAYEIFLDDRFGKPEIPEEA
jgi:hypothetical protein